MFLIETCKTVKGEPCHFPFEYQGKHCKCTMKDADTMNGKAWCSTTEDGNDEFFGDCSDECLVEGGTYCKIVLNL